MFSNLVASLFTHERIRTTDTKAKATRRLAERTITWARRLGDVLTKDPDGRTADERARVVHAMRMARRVVRDRGAVLKLFDEIGPRYLGRHGGYTRIVKIGQRVGDAAPMSILELVPDVAPAGAPAASPPAKPAAKAKGKTAEGEAEAGSAATAKSRAKSSSGKKAAPAKAEASAKGSKATKAPAKAKSPAKSKSKSGK